METITTDVLIIGAGAAGIRAALSASEAEVETLIISKGDVTYSGSTFSPVSRGWGIQALVGEERHQVRDEESPAPVGVTDVRKAPDISQADCRTDSGEEKRRAACPTFTMFCHYSLLFQYLKL